MLYIPSDYRPDGNTQDKFSKVLYHETEYFSNAMVIIYVHISWLGKQVLELKAGGHEREQ